MTRHDGGAPPPGTAPATPSGDAVPDFTQKAQENAHHEDPITEQAWLGNEPDLFPCCGSSPASSATRLLRIERTARRALTAFENGEFEAGVTHIENTLSLAMLHRALELTTEGLKQ
ncbi:hypothetical protein [Arthrobacter silvisoli]|uniref:hypothetical protein n=1 Tax=Arthrobacter silvisoli TaxID=2291022 RepID=UPI000E21B219|nr:hypothetical protein [Arthrobacter silvisoli]